MKASLEDRLHLNRRAAAGWARGFVIAACIWTVLAALQWLAWMGRGDIEGPTVGEVILFWAFVGVPLLALAAICFGLSRWPRSHER
jgi:hypothetical protein